MLGGFFKTGVFFIALAVILGAGYGPAAAPVGISSPAALQNMSNNLGGEYYLTQNIDLSGFSFSPVGTAGSPFTGSFDGRGFTIFNLRIVYEPDEDDEDDLSLQAPFGVGLFGFIGSGGLVRNVRLSNALIAASSGVGGLAGQNNGIIMESYALSDITAENSAGGLVGHNEGEIIKSYSSGSVTGRYQTGGFVGYNGGRIVDCYSRASALGDARTGGFAGFNAGEMSNTFSTGYVFGAFGSSGGLVGLNSGIVANSFWDVETSRIVESDGGTFLWTVEMKARDRFVEAGWNFNSVWSLNSAYNSGYPFLRWRWDAPPDDDTTPAPDPGPWVDPDNEYDLMCFIATAAYGSPFAGEVTLLRNFRDVFLSKNAAGRNLVLVYYRISPVLSGIIDSSDALKFLSRAHIAPFVRFSCFMLSLGSN